MSEAFTIAQSDDTCRFEGVLDFGTARGVLQDLAHRVGESEQLTIDFSGAGRCNSAALAVLIELQATARRHGHEVRFRAVPDGIRQLAKVCQVETWI